MVICRRCAEACLSVYGFGRVGREAIVGWMDRHHGPACQLEPQFSRIDVVVSEGTIRVVGVDDAN